MTDNLSSAAVTALLSAPARWQVEVIEQTGSTNTDLKARGAAGAPDGCVLVADRQNAGRGRMTRSFYSPSGSGLYMSMLLRPKLAAADALLLTAAAAVAAAETIERELKMPASIKWVNDIFVGGRKVCGILTEGSLNAATGGLDFAVVGIGLNVREPEGGFPDALHGVAGALLPAFAPVDEGLRSRLCAGILTRAAMYFDALPARTFFDGYRARSLVIGRTVLLTPGEERVTVEGIDDSCRLLVRDGAGNRRAVSSGECSCKIDL